MVIVQGRELKRKEQKVKREKNTDKEGTNEIVL